VSSDGNDTENYFVNLFVESDDNPLMGTLSLILLFSRTS
jgi:hypothetical protein